ncbi:MAG: glycosyltransferase family 2 protein [Hyphomicrobiales bacterium]|nr:MAG: glycosyltransferase family 2 protein [Hyphomicrobiales bacterium]
MRIVVVIATAGRPAIAGQALARLSRLRRPPSDLLVVGAAPEDAPEALGPARYVVAPKRGLAAQRNQALDLIGAEADIVVFVDDDYAPAPGFVEGVERLFATHPDIVAASGHLIADGINRGGLTFEQADALIACYRPATPWLKDSSGTYGCNMAFRLCAAPHLRFDENLPLYGWLEDTDYSARYAAFGRVVRTNHFAGVHLGARTGRLSGVRLGYSQIANPLYLWRKGTASARFALLTASRNMLANLVRSLRPEAHIDRRGRLRGNLLALSDMLNARCAPGRILDL